jgi:hypothetical protein
MSGSQAPRTLYRPLSRETVERGARADAAAFRCRVRVRKQAEARIHVDGARMGAHARGRGRAWLSARCVADRSSRRSSSSRTARSATKAASSWLVRTSPSQRRMTSRRVRSLREAHQTRARPPTIDRSQPARLAHPGHRHANVVRAVRSHAKDVGARERSSDARRDGGHGAPRSGHASRAPRRRTTRRDRREGRPTCNRPALRPGTPAGETTIPASSRDR